MREIFYKYDNRGVYVTQDDTSFGADEQLKIIAMPHNFSLEVGGEVLRDTSFSGCEIVVSSNGAVEFFDNEHLCLAKVEKCDNTFKKVLLKWSVEEVAIEFGRIVEVDYYPNCDGESDRYGEKWDVQRVVKLNLKDNSVKV